MSFVFTTEMAASGGGETNIPLFSTDNWTLTNIAGGTASINTGSEFFDVTVPASAAINSGGEAAYNLSGEYFSPYDCVNLEVGAQLSLFQNCDSNSRAVLSLRTASSGWPSFSIIAWGDGTLETGWTNGSGSFSSYGFTTPALVPTDGRLWLRLRCRGSMFEAGWAIGTMGDPRPNNFTVLSNRVNAFRDQGEPPFTNLHLFGVQITSIASEMKVQFQNIWASIIA
ncbi:MAG: hypothetical protein KBD78_03950 [Oligoflexales bacterium]|nr:hypothetical protein [Oligoflexales bacterium]